MNKTRNNIVYIFDKTHALYKVATKAKDHNLREIYKHRLKIIRYSSQLISLLSFIQDEDEKNGLFSIDCFSSNKNNLSEDVDLSDKNIITLSDKTINNELIDDYLTVIGELIQGLYQLHNKKSKLGCSGKNDRNR